MRFLGHYLGIVGLLAAACGDDGATTTGETACVAGSTQACACTNGLSGAQACRADGSAFEACVCDGGPTSSTTGTPSSTPSSADVGSGAGGETSSSAESTTDVGTGANGAGGEATTGQAGGGPGSGGAGTGGGDACEQDQTEPCYDGDPREIGVGICVAGERTCQGDGTFGECVGQVGPEDDDCSTNADENCDGFTPPCPAPWATRIGTTMGSSYIAGMDVGPDGSSVVAVSGGAGFVLINGIQSEPAGSSFVVGLTPTGSARWLTSFHGAQVSAIALAPDGTTVVGGVVQDSGDLGGDFLDTNGAFDAFVVRLDADGQNIGQVTIGGTGNEDERTYSVDIQPNGEVVAAGTYFGTDATIDGISLPDTGEFPGTFVAKLGATDDVAWAHGFAIWSFPAVALDEEGGVALAQGSFASAPVEVDLGDGPVGLRGFSARFDADGELTASRAFDADGTDRILSGGFLTFLDNGALLQTALIDGGSCDVGTGPIGSFPAYMAVESDRGSLIAAYGFGSSTSGAGQPQALARRGNGAVMAGRLTQVGPVTLGEVDLPAVDGAYVALLDSSSSVVDATSFACGNAGQLFGVGADASGTILLAGTATNACELAGSTLPDGGGFIARLDWPR